MLTVHFPCSPCMSISCGDGHATTQGHKVSRAYTDWIRLNRLLRGTAHAFAALPDAAPSAQLQGAVWSCVLNDPALLCATGSADFTARVWDACSGTQMHEFSHPHIVRSTNFSHLGNKLATGCEFSLWTRLAGMHSARHTCGAWGDHMAVACGYDYIGRIRPMPDAAHVWYVSIR